MTGRLLVLDCVREETEHSPEFRYLRSWNLEEMRAVFAEVVVATGRPAEALGTGGWTHLLLLTDDQVLLGRRSLNTMRLRIDDRLDRVSPAPLASSLPPDTPPLYTLRGYEAVEERVLAVQEPAEEGFAAFPISLWRGDALPWLAPYLDRLGSPEAERELAAMAGSRTGIAGIYHRFIDYYGEVRSDILPLVPPGVREVLEVGCARGLTGRLLEERLGCRVTGVEMNPVAARDAARNLSAVLCGDVETLDIPGRYDLILGLELFEHLQEQERFLARMKQLLAPGGTVLLSVPNVGHYSIVQDLLAGRWDYLPIGLLCYTHYRFFTRPTLDNWARRSGFQDVQLVPQKTELPESFLDLARQAGTALDLESLATKGFYVLLRG